MKSDAEEARKEGVARHHRIKAAQRAAEKELREHDIIEMRTEQARLKAEAALRRADRRDGT